MTGSYGAGLKYHFPINSFSPYIGGGVFYNSYNISEAGGLDVIIHNNAAAEISAGITSNPENAFNFFIELGYVINNPSYEQSTNVFTGIKSELVKGTYNNNALHLRIGILFNLYKRQNVCVN